MNLATENVEIVGGGPDGQTSGLQKIERRAVKPIHTWGRLLACCNPGADAQSFSVKDRYVGDHHIAGGSVQSFH